MKFDNRLHLVNAKYTCTNYKENTICKLGTVSALPLQDKENNSVPTVESDYPRLKLCISLDFMHHFDFMHKYYIFNCIETDLDISEPLGTAI
jgi:hypothetical protein